MVNEVVRLGGQVPVKPSEATDAETGGEPNVIFPTTTVLSESDDRSKRREDKDQSPDQSVHLG